MSQIEIPPELQELVRKLNRVEEMIVTTNSIRKVLEDSFFALKTEVAELIKESAFNQGNPPKRGSKDEKTAP